MNPPWLITQWYFVVLGTIVVIAKLLSIVLSNRTPLEKLQFFLIAPSLSIDTWNLARRLESRDLRKIGTQSIFVFPLVIAVYAILPDIISRNQFSWPARAYLAIVPFWLLTQALSLATQLLYAPVSLTIPPWHKQPWRAASLAEFWGRRWNRLFADWMRQVCFRPLFRMPRLGIVFAFITSGLIHELLVNLPLWLVFRVNLFGSMCIYFLLQAAGIFVEKQFLKRNRLANRVFMWAIVLLPVPLALNEGTLRIFHFVR